METLPIQVHKEILKYLQLKDLQNLSLVSAKWRARATISMRLSKKICINFNKKEKLINFLQFYQYGLQLPSLSFQFNDTILSEQSLRDKVEEFATKFGYYVYRYNLRGGPFTSSRDHQTLLARECLCLNISLLLNKASENLAELSIRTHYELGPRALPTFRILRTVDIWYTVEEFQFFDQTFISEISTKVPAIRSFGIHNDLNGGSRQFTRKLPRMIGSLISVNPNIRLRLSILLNTEDVTFLEDLFNMITPLPKVSELVVKPILGKNWSEQTRTVICGMLPHWLYVQRKHLTKLVLGVRLLPSDAELKLPRLRALKDLDIHHFRPHVHVTPFTESQFPRLNKLNIDIESITWLVCPLPTVQQLILHARKIDSAVGDLPSRLIVLFPNLRNLKIIEQGVDQGQFNILSGIMKPMSVAEICKPIPQGTNLVWPIPPFKNWKYLHRLEVVSCSLESVAALIYISMIGQVVRLKQLVLRFPDEVDLEIEQFRPANHFIEELKKHHDEVTTYFDCILEDDDY